MTIDDKTGKTKYTEYGRYSPEGKGIVGAKLPAKDGNFRNVSVPNVKIGKDGKSTAESLKKAYDSLSKSAGHGSEVKATMHSDADASKVQGAIDKLANNPNRETYSIVDNNCKTVRDDVIKAGEK